jgi:hypothetical protein
MFIKYLPGGGGGRGSLMVKVLCYKPVALGSEVHSASNRNEYEKQKNSFSAE